MDKTKYKIPIETIILLFYSALHFFFPLLLVLTFPFWIFPYLIACMLKKSKNLLDWALNMKNKIQKRILGQMEYAILKGNGRYLRIQDNKVL
jgi:hypothetical protein